MDVILFRLWMKNKSTGICFVRQKLGEDYVDLTICENRCLREQKLFTISEISDSLKISKATVKYWAKNNTLKSYKYNDKNERLYQRPGQELINKLRDEKRQGRSKHLIKLLSNRINEVQYEV